MVAKELRITAKGLLHAILVIAVLAGGCGRAPEEPAQGDRLPGERTPADIRPSELAPSPDSSIRATRSGDRVLIGPLVSDSRSPEFFWSPGGRWVAFTDGEGNLWRVAPDGADLKLLLRPRERVFEGHPEQGMVLPLAWRGEERLLVGVVGYPGAGDTEFTVASIDLESGRAERHGSIPTGMYRGHPKWWKVSSDQRYVTLHVHGVKPDYNGLVSITELWIVDVEASQARRLVTDLPSWDGLYSVYFSPDGQKVAYPRESGSGMRLFVLDVAQGIEAEIPVDTVFVDRVVWSRDGRYLAYAIGVEGRYQRYDDMDWSTLLGTFVQVATADGAPVGRLEVEGRYVMAGPYWLPEGRLLVSEASLGKRSDGPDPATGNTEMIVTDRWWAAQPPGWKLTPLTAADQAALETPPPPQEEDWPMSRGEHPSYQAEFSFESGSSPPYSPVYTLTISPKHSPPSMPKGEAASDRIILRTSQGNITLHLP